MITTGGKHITVNLEICSASGALCEEWLSRSGRWNAKTAGKPITVLLLLFLLKKYVDKYFICNNIITYEALCFERRTKMYNIAIIMPVIGMIGFFIIVAIKLVIGSREKREEIKSVDAARFNSFAEEMRRENAEMKKDLQIVKEKVEAIDKMMKDI